MVEEEENGEVERDIEAEAFVESINCEEDDRRERLDRDEREREEKPFFERNPDCVMWVFCILGFYGFGFLLFYLIHFA